MTASRCFDCFIAPPCGGLDRAPLLEAAAVLAVGIWWSGTEIRPVFPTPAHAPGAVDD